MQQKDKAVTTNTLLNRLFRTSSFARFKAQHKDVLGAPSLCDYLNDLCRARGEAHETVIKRASLDWVYGHQIFCGRKHPSRDKVIQLAFGLKMNETEAQALLQVAGQSRLYPRIERDAVILFCLHNGMSMLETQELLTENGLPILGGGVTHE